MKTLIWRGQGRNWAVSQTFLLIIFCSKTIFKTDLNCFFKVLAKFVDYKDNRHKKRVFFSIDGGGKILMENTITFSVFFMESFP